MVKNVISWPDQGARRGSGLTDEPSSSTPHLRLSPTTTRNSIAHHKVNLY